MGAAEDGRIWRAMLSVRAFCRVQGRRSDLRGARLRFRLAHVRLCWGVARLGQVAVRANAIERRRKPGAWVLPASRTRPPCMPWRLCEKRVRGRASPQLWGVCLRRTAHAAAAAAAAARTARRRRLVASTPPQPAARKRGLCDKPAAPAVSRVHLPHERGPRGHVQTFKNQTRLFGLVT